MKKGKRIKAFAAVLMLLALTAGCGWFLLVPCYRQVLIRNWGIKLPIYAVLREVYSKSESGFHGDGLRFHVFSYRYEDFVELMFAWGSNERETLYYSSISETAEIWLIERDVPQKQRPRLNSCSHWYRAAEDGSEILFLFDAQQNLLYVLESFI